MAMVTAIVFLAVSGGTILLALTRNQAPDALEWFAVATAWLVIAMFLWPSQFHYHFAAFLAPFLALAIALPVGRIIPASAESHAERNLATAAATAAVALITIFAVIQAGTEAELSPGVPYQSIAAAERLIPAGSCVISDSVTMLLLANRFNSSIRGCTLIDDGLGTDLALSHGLAPSTGAGKVPAVARLWLRSLRHAQYLWLSVNYTRRIPLTTAWSRYLRKHFKLIYTDRYGDTLRRAVAGPGYQIRTRAAGSSHRASAAPTSNAA
jgi:hypothetical protein